MEKPYKYGELEYCDLISDIGYDNKDSLCWWGSNISSKNYGASPLWKTIRDYVNRICKYETSKNSGILDLIKSFIHYLYRIYFLAPLKLRMLKIDKNNSNVIAITYFLKSSFKDSGYVDQYHQVLIDRIKDKNVIIIGHVMQDDVFIKKHFNENILPVEYFLKPSDLVKAFIKTIISGIKLPEEVRFKGFDIKSILMDEYEKEKYSGSIFHNICYYYAFRNMFNIINICTIYMPWENHCWEKMLFIAKNKYSAKTKIVAALSFAIPPYYLNMFPGKKEKDYAPFPNKIITTGRTSYEMLNSFGSFPVNCLVKGASFRYKYINEIKASRSSLLQKDIIGFVMSSAIDDNIKMIQMACELLNNKDSRIIVRYHPDLPQKEVLKHVESKYHDNLVGDTGSMELFLSKIKILIYTDTSVCFDAAAAGVPLIYYDTGSALATDRMFFSNALKWKVSDSEELAKTISVIESLPLDELNRQRDAARIQVQEYFSPMNEEEIKKYID